MADVVELIERDHREVEQLFAEFKSSGDSTIADKVCDELTKHTFGEERAVYPVVADKLPNGKKLVGEADKEHKEARHMIGRVRNTTNPDHLKELMAELEAAIQHHVREEENEMLPKARQEISAEELDEMGRQFEEAKEAAGRQSA